MTIRGLCIPRSTFYFTWHMSYNYVLLVFSRMDVDSIQKSLGVLLSTVTE